jgi:hypothetical protein
MLDDFKKEWPRLRKQLMRYSQEALVLAKRGEEKIKDLSKEGKLRFDVTTLGVKKEHLYYRIGKEFVKSRSAGKENPRLHKLLEELKRVNKEMRTLNRKIKDS